MSRNAKIKADKPGRQVAGHAGALACDSLHRGMTGAAMLRHKLDRERAAVRPTPFYRFLEAS
jgi:hypothetical protein